MATKQVRLLRPVWIDQQDRVVPVDATFWKDVRGQLGVMNAGQRRFRLSGSEYYGLTGIGVSPAVSYVRVGKLRPPADWPDTVDPAGRLDALVLGKGIELFEGGFFVPYGPRSEVAYMGPLQGTLGMRAIESWFGVALQLPAKGYRLEFQPLIDHEALNLLVDSIGVSKLTVTIPSDAPLGDLPENDPVTRAVHAATSHGNTDLDVNLTWSHGHRRPGQMAEMLKGAAQKMVSSRAATRIEASMVLPQEGGFRTEVRNLVEDVISLKAEFDVDDSQRLTIDEVLEGIMGAIHKFREGER